MLMAFGLEGRVPYLDHRIVELGLALPDDLKVQGRVGKRLLKRWAQHYLPPHHLARPKKGFGVPLAEPFQGPFLERLGERLAADRAISTWFKPEAVPTLVARQRARGDAEEPLLQLTQIALWYQLLIEHPDRRPGADEALLDWLA
jgi:asparagine synthase (glutamine-hydrolysing)